MIDAIFIHSCRKEIFNQRLPRFLYSYKESLNKDIDIFLFLDDCTLNDYKFMDLSFIKKIICINDKHINNKISYQFNFLMNFNLNKYQKILNLETDCKLENNFIEFINKDLTNYLDNWFIYGSKYYGNGHSNLATNNSDNSLYIKNHMNGVAIYNRCENFINFFNTMYKTMDMNNLLVNYDYVIYEQLLQYNFYNKCIDSDFIINLSHKSDINLNFLDFKPKAKIIHQKPSN